MGEVLRGATGRRAAWCRSTPGRRGITIEARRSAIRSNLRTWLQSIAETPGLLASRPVRSRSGQWEAQTAKVEVQPDHPIAKALATDERMQNLWNLIGDWPGALDLIQSAVHYGNGFLLANLEQPPERRTAFGFAASWISGAAEDFAVALEMFPDIAAELWGEAIDDLVQRLRAFGGTASQKASEARAFYDFMPAPSRRGRGDTHQLLFRDAAAWVLKRLVVLHGGQFSQSDQDEIVAILAGVVFRDREIDPETVRRHRERHKKRVRDSSV